LSPRESTYITNYGYNDVSVIDKVIATIGVGCADPYGLAVSPDGNKVYVTTFYSGSTQSDRRSDRDGDRHHRHAAL
jgi:YVTN family beta-propeller protein